MQELVHPSLDAAIRHSGVPANKWALGEPFEAVAPRDRTSLFLVADAAYAAWDVPTLKSLFRGNVVPPELRDYPPQYVPAFFQLEQHLIFVARLVGRVPTDSELEELWANLRRRPDGRSLGPVHDSLWQASALLLGRFALSEAEYTAIVGRLSRSASGWKKGPTSREYMGYLTRTFGNGPPRR